MAHYLCHGQTVWLVRRIDCFFFGVVQLVVTAVQMDGGEQFLLLLHGMSLGGGVNGSGGGGEDDEENNRDCSLLLTLSN